MQGYKDILVYGETVGETLTSMTAQLLGGGKKLASQRGCELHLVVLGGGAQKGAAQGFGFGVDRVYEATDPQLEHYVTDSYVQAMEQIVKEQEPEIVLIGQNSRGLDFAPRLAFRLGASITLDCVGLEIDQESGLLIQEKPVFGGKAHARFCTPGRLPQIVTVREGAFDPAVIEQWKEGEVIQLNPLIDPSKTRTRYLTKIEDESLALAIKLSSARVVVSGGRGVRKKEGFEILTKTAMLFDGAIAGSRPAIDNGWLPNSLQVGLTGKKISPEIYFAVGISGAIQHMAGCLKSKSIVGINKDRDAPIFAMSHYGVVADYREVLEAFIDEVRRMRGDS